jgi:hypothetical protein
MKSHTCLVYGAYCYPLLARAEESVWDAEEFKELSKEHFFLNKLSIT